MSITLIGMAGVGKSTIGKKLANKLNYSFLDIDRLIEDDTGLKLQQIISNYGEKKFLKIEETQILKLEKLKNFVISPGGSVVYSPRAMRFLKKNSLIIFLDCSFEIILKNIKNKNSRGIVWFKNKNLKEIFRERKPLYTKYADIIFKIPKNFDTNKAINYLIKKIQEHRNRRGKWKCL